MSYKNLLLGRHAAALDAQDEPALLSYLDLRNQEALRAWRERCAAVPELEKRRYRRSWLSALVRLDSLRH